MERPTLFLPGVVLVAMPDGARLTSVETVRERGSWLCTAADDRRGEAVEVVLVPCESDGGIRAWVNRCTHEAQRLHRGGALGAVRRDGGIVCPRHGSTFDACTGDCDNGEAAGTTLVPVGVTVADGDVYLTDEDRTFRHEGPKTAGGDGDDEDGDDGPGSTSHIGF
jgi:nitrite reductase/ring-hydroxylating ferredoxin subunit